MRFLFLSVLHISPNICNCLCFEGIQKIRLMKDTATITRLPGLDLMRGVDSIEFMRHFHILCKRSGHIF